MTIQIEQANARWAPLEQVIIEQLAAGDGSMMTMVELCNNEAVFTAAAGMFQYRPSDAIATAENFIRRGIVRLVRRKSVTGAWIVRLGRKYGVGPAAAIWLASQE